MTIPYFEKSNITIYCNDCLLIMNQFEENSIDLTITSPPYDNLRTYEGIVWSEEVWKAALQSLFRITKVGGVVVWVVGDATINGSETGTSFKQALWAKECGFNLHDTMIYQKDNPPPVGGNNRYFQHFEYMFVFSKGKPKTFNPITSTRRNKWEDKRTHRVKAFVRDKNGNFLKKETSLTGDVKIGNIWKYVCSGGSAVDFGTNHPAGFSPQLVHDHIISWSNPDEIVFDPFMGSGTTLLVASELGRKSIGIEISKNYCESAIIRLNKKNKIENNVWQGFWNFQEKG